MCLATVYKESDNTVIMENTARIDVDGDFVIVEDIVGEQTKIQGRIKWVDLAASKVMLVCD